MRVDVDIISAYPIMNIYMDKNMWSVFQSQEKVPYFWIERSDGGFPTRFPNITSILKQLEIEAERNKWDKIDIDIFKYTFSQRTDYNLNHHPISVTELEETINRFIDEN